MGSGAPDFLERLTTCLSKAGFSRRTLALRTGISINTINGWYKYVRYPRGDDLVRIAETIGTTCEYLVTGIGTEKARKDGPASEIAEFLDKLDEGEKLQVIGAMKAVLYLKLSSVEKVPT